LDFCCFSCNSEIPDELGDEEDEEEDNEEDEYGDAEENPTPDEDDTQEQEVRVF
jgi:hypothetical protein